MISIKKISLALPSIVLILWNSVGYSQSIPSPGLSNGGTQTGTFNSCTLYNDRLVDKSRRCVKFEQVGSCVRQYKYVQWEADLVQAWIPDYFIEVSPRFGKSMLENSGLSALLKSQIDSAVQTWKQATKFAGTSASTMIANTPDEGRNGTDKSNERSRMLYGRILSLPMGSLYWNYAAVAGSKGSLQPSCFDAISEFDVKIWNSMEGNPDEVDAKAKKSLGAALCMNMTSSIAQAVAGEAAAMLSNNLTGLPHWFYESRNLKKQTADIASRCASPSVFTVPLINNSNDYLKTCASNLGPLFPRSGQINTDERLMGSLLAAHRIASIGSDRFHAATNVEINEKWQLIYPRILSSVNANIPGVSTFVDPTECFYPRGILPVFPIENRLAPGAEEQSYIFAVYKLRQYCTFAPGLGAAHIEAWNTQFELNKGLCSAVNSSSPEPSH